MNKRIYRGGAELIGVVFPSDQPFNSLRLCGQNVLFITPMVTERVFCFSPY
jgi:hypothetical protein